jgi:hypothetical protein
MVSFTSIIPNASVQVVKRADRQRGFLNDRPVPKPPPEDSQCRIVTLNNKANHLLNFTGSSIWRRFMSQQLTEMCPVCNNYFRWTILLPSTTPWKVISDSACIMPILANSLNVCPSILSGTNWWILIARV